MAVINLGKDALGREVELELNRSPFLTEGMNMALIANKGGGKSYAQARLCEQAYAARLPFIVYDPRGDAVSLRELGDDVLVVGPRKNTGVRKAHLDITDVVAMPRKFFAHALGKGFSVVFDLSGMDLTSQVLYFAAFAEAHYEIACELRMPHLMVIDEAHRFAPQSPDKAQKGSLKAMVMFASDGRKAGAYQVFCTQRATYLSKDVLFAANVRLFGKITYRPDYYHVTPYLPEGTGFKDVNDLASGEFFLIYSQEYKKVKIGPRTTTDLGGTPMFIPQADRPRPTLDDMDIFTQSSFL